MTADELRKLAEIAGLKYEETLGGTIFIDSLPVTNAVWQPHFNIKQAMMVENSIPEIKRCLYIEELSKIVGINLIAAFYYDSYNYLLFRLVNATADQRCRAALAAEKEGADAFKEGVMDGLKMKYFVLKPAGNSPYAKASRSAMRAYAEIICDENYKLAIDLEQWAGEEEVKAKEVQ